MYQLFIDVYEIVKNKIVSFSKMKTFIIGHSIIKFNEYQ